MAMIIADASAQNSQVLYYMNLPQNHFNNPALRPSNSLYIGLPAVSGINLNINNNFVNFSDIFMKGPTGDSILSFLHPGYNINNFLAKIHDKNWLEPQVSVQLFGLGFSVGKDAYLFLDINERMEGNVVLPGDLFKLALTGNGGFIGNKIDFSAFRGDLRYYREAGLGFSKNLTNKLRIGVKGKLLFGIAGLSTDNRSFGISVGDTSRQDYSNTLNSDIIVNISAPVNININSGHDIQSVVFDDKRFDTSSGISDFLLGKKNIGLGLDIGAVYDISDKLMVSAAITDLGFIKWKKDVTNLKIKSQFKFSGINIVDVINGVKTFEEAGNDMVDSLKNAFTVSGSNVRYTDYLPFGVTLGGSYNLSKDFSLGLLSYSRVIGKQIRESLTLSANLNLGNALSTSISYTAANRQYDNLGAGLSFRAGIFQFYMLADRIPLMWNVIKGEMTIPDIIGSGTHSNPYSLTLPANWNTLNLRLGMNLVFGNKNKKKSDRPMVIVE